MTDRSASAASAPAQSVSEAPTFVPPADIFETKDALVMLLDMPGVDPDSLNVTLENRVLTVSARSTISIPEGYTLVHGEFQLGNYERAFTLADQIDSDRIEAVFKDGVLRLTLPKAASPAKKIAVKAA